MSQNFQITGGGAGGGSSPSLTTAPGGLWLPAYTMIFNSLLSNTGSNVPINGSVYGCAFVLPIALSFTKVSVKLSAASGSGGSGNFNVGIYSSDGNTKLLDAAFSASSTSVQTVTKTKVNLSAGTYIFAFGSDCTSGTITANPSYGNIGGNMHAVMNQNSTRVFTAGNTVSAGVLPSTLGVLTSTDINAIAAFFEP